MRKLIPTAARTLAASCVLLLSSGVVFTQPMPRSLFDGLRWRLIGPFRAGRVSAGAIDPDPNTYYIGTPGGGVWKTTDGGQVWTPIFDAEHVASIGAIAVSQSNPKIIYVGTGEQTWGNGIYKSADAGATWTNAGLRDTRFVGEVLVDPGNPDVVLVAAIGDLRNQAPAAEMSRFNTTERGVFKSTDGGRTWTKTLFKEDAGGSTSMVWALDNPKVVYATLAPAPARGTGAAGAAGGAGQAARGPAPSVTIYKSVDQGSTWAPVGGKGLPPSFSGRQAVAIAAGTQGRRVFTNTRDGLFRSDDGGETWERWTTDPRIAGIGIIADPKNPDVMYVTQTSMYRTADGGRTWASYVGAPSGDDFRLLWIDPRNSSRLLAGVDQGGIVSVDAGKTWSNWYTQPTAQLYHVSTDTAFPYRVYATQQDSGSVAVPSRSDFGEISFRDWYSPGAFEWGFIAPDPLDPAVAYGESWYDAVIRFDKRTEQLTHVFVPGSKYRSAQMTPLAFSPQDPHTLYLCTQFVMKTTDAGMHWSETSPDLTVTAKRPAPKEPAQNRAAIFTFSPSPVKAGVMWIGTSNGIVQTTADGATWTDVTPPDVPANATIAMVEAGRHDAATAYAVVNVPQVLRHFIYRTHDNGRTWQPIVSGLDTSGLAFTRVVREDPVRKGLLYAGTESAVYVSFDDGDNWQSLQLNLPTSSMRDLVVHGDDLIVGTYGRSIWILDDVMPLREATAATAAEAVHFFKPQTAVRWRWDMNQDTPLPIETPVGQNPPDGAIFDYYLKDAPAGEITLTIADAHGAVVRRYTSTPPPAPTLPSNVPEYWFGAPVALPKAAGINRFAWNLRYPTPKVLPFGYFGGFLKYIEYTVADHAIPGQTPREQPEGALVTPGEYVATLEVGGKTFRQPLTVKADPRVRATQADLVEQEALAKRIGGGLAVSYERYYQLKAKDEKSKTADDIGVANRDLARYLAMLESGDGQPSETLLNAVNQSCEALDKALVESGGTAGACKM